MSKLKLKASPTSVILRVKLLDSTKSDGSGITGLSSASASLIISTIKIGESSPVYYSVASSKIETIATLGTYASPTSTKCRFREIESTYHKGVYEIQFDNARFASTSQLLVSIQATNAAQQDFEIDMGLDDANVAQWNGTNVAAPNTAGVPLVDMVRINGGLTNTNQATLSLAGLNISGTGVPLVVASTSGGNAAKFSGGGSVGMSDGVIKIVSASGDGIRIVAGPSGAGIRSTGGQLPDGSMSAPGIVAQGGAGAPGMLLSKGANYEYDFVSQTTLMDVHGATYGYTYGNIYGNIDSCGVVGTINSDVNMSYSSADRVWSSTTAAMDSNIGLQIARFVWNEFLSNARAPLSFGSKIKDWIMGSDNKVLISANAQDLSTTLDVRTKAYATGQDPATLVLATPANKLTTNASGQVLVTPGTSSGQIDLTSGQVKVQVGTGAGQINASSGAVPVSDKTGFSLTSGEKTNIATAVWASATRTLTSLSGNATDIAAAVWSALTSGMVTAGSIGKKLTDWVLGSDNKVLLSNNAQTGVTIPTVTAVTNDVGITQAGADKVWSTGSRVATSVSGSVGSVTGAVGSVTGNVGGNVNGKVIGGGATAITGTGVQAQLPNDAITSAKIDATATAEIAAAVWDILTAGHTTASTFGAQVKTIIDAISTATGTTIPGVLSDIKGAGWTSADAMTSLAHTGSGGGTVKDVQDSLVSISSKVDDVHSATDLCLGGIDDTKGLCDGINLTTTATALDVSTVEGKVDTSNSRLATIVSKLPSTGTISNINLDTTIDGVEVSAIYELVMAMVNGKYVLDDPSVGNITFYKRDDNTPLFVVNVTNTTRARV